MSLNVPALRSSFDLVLEREPEVTKRFYGHLFTRYPQVRPLFSRGAPELQQKMLAEMLVAVVDHLEDAEWLVQNLRALGVRHDDYGITPEMYPWVGECLLQTLSEIAGDQWTPEVAQAWTDAYGAIVSLMGVKMPSA